MTTPRITWPQYLRMEPGRTGIRRDDEYVVLEVQIDDEWLALYYLVGHGGHLAISEVRVLPRPRNGIEQKRLNEARQSPARVRVTSQPAGANGISMVDGDDAPPPLPSSALRELKAEQAIKVARSGLPNMTRHRAGIDSLVLGAGVRQARRKAAASPYETAVVAAHYDDVLRAGGRGNVDVASRLRGYDAPRVKRTIERARSDGYLSTSGKQGRQGGDLQPEARAILDQGPPPGYTGPKPPPTG